MEAEIRNDVLSSFELQFSDSWVFEIDILTSPGGNSGIFYLDNKEFQVISATHSDASSGKTSFGAEYNDIAPVTYPAYPGKEDGEWNRVQIRKEANKIYHF